MTASQANSHTLVRPAGISQRLIGLLMIAISLGYLCVFVPRGWVPHDEGMIGQSAERVLLGGIPHVDYEEPYTGGLTWLHAAVFKFSGVDLLNLRWLLFGGASLALLLTYSILRRYFTPIGAALAVWVGLAWSFPNYFAAMPSWWILICALCGLWAFVRYIETGILRYAAMAGLAAGFAIIIKQTGVYLLVALVMSLLYEGGHPNQVASPGSRSGRFICVSVAVAAFLLALAIVRLRLAPAEMLYLLLPIAACSRLLLTADGGSQLSSARWGFSGIGIAVASAVLPFACFVAPYIVHDQVGSLIQGLVILPQKRLIFASMEMPPAQLILAGVPLVALVTPFPRAIRSSAIRRRLIGPLLWILALALSVASLRSIDAYELIWQSSRAFAALLPVVICWRLISGHIRDTTQRRILFGLASMLAWASLVQFPFSAPIYFCYVAPLAILAGAAAAAGCSSLQRSVIGAWVALLLVFAVFSMNRGYIYDLGEGHAPQALNVELDLARAHLDVSPDDALTYRRLVPLISSHLGDGRLIAGPDCPEVYFLVGRFNPSGALFDFFSNDVFGEQNGTAATEWMATSVVVLNHRSLFSNRRSMFSPTPSSHLTSEIRRLFPEGESVGRFEVRWR